ncbi:MAG: hypothetical protein AAFZ15_15355 [Bacteroidota bacterium]
MKSLINETNVVSSASFNHQATFVWHCCQLIKKKYKLFDYLYDSWFATNAHSCHQLGKHFYYLLPNDRLQPAIARSPLEMYENTVCQLNKLKLAGTTFSYLFIREINQSYLSGDPSAAEQNTYLDGG